MNTNEIVGIGVMILCGVVLVVQILGLLLSIFTLVSANWC